MVSILPYNIITKIQSSQMPIPRHSLMAPTPMTEPTSSVTLTSLESGSRGLHPPYSSKYNELLLILPAYR